MESKRPPSHLQLLTMPPTKRRKSYKQTEAEARRKVEEDSFCTVEAFGASDNPTGLWIGLGGYAANLPSKTNRRALYTQVTKGGKRIYRIGQAPRERGVTDAMTTLLQETLAFKKLSNIRFTGLVSVLVLCADKAGTWDSHNTVKFVGDWLQSVGILSNDSNAEILAFKKGDYLETSELRGTTQIVILPRDKIVTDITRGYIAELKKISAGQKYIG